MDKLTDTEEKLISVILPTFNERDNILALIAQISENLNPYAHEIIVVDDNSSDGTCAAVEEAKPQKVRVFKRVGARGLGSAIRFGLERARGQYCVVMDSDFNHQPQYLPFMLREIIRYDCVCASRFLPGGRMSPRRRYFLSKAFNSVVRIVTGSRLSDNLYGFFMIRREILEQCYYEAIFRGFGDYYLRLTHALQKNNASILEFPAVNGERLSGRGNTQFLRTFGQYSLSVVTLLKNGRL